MNLVFQDEFMHSAKEWVLHLRCFACMQTGVGLNGASYVSWVGGGWYVQNTSLQQTSEQSDNNSLNKDFGFWNRTDYRGFPGKAYSVQRFLSETTWTTDWKQQKAGKRTISKVFHMLSGQTALLVLCFRKMPSTILASISKSSTSSATFSCSSDLIWSDLGYFSSQVMSDKSTIKVIQFILSLIHISEPTRPP